MTELFGDSTRDGEWAAVRLEVDGQRIVRADAPGLDRDLAGLSLLEAAAVGGETLAVDALANALGPAVAGAAQRDRVAVAMSGGVDSAVALLEAGRAAVGVTLRLWVDPRAAKAERACCSPESVIAARRTCHRLGLPHITLDRRERFRASVVSPFTDAYRRGETPNPCVRCNGVFRFDELLAAARRLGAARLATGHYARVLRSGGRHVLARGLDPRKDQSYMLATLDPASLASLWFPLGERTKEQTRARALAAGLDVAASPESQNACFLGGDDYRSFLAREGFAARSGALVDLEGRELGRHEGYWRYTPGQRRGLGIAAAEPLYALETHPSTNTVLVGPRAALARREVSVEGRLDAAAGPVEAKLRYRSPPLPGEVSASANGFELRLEEPAYGVARGQTAVLYRDEIVVGAGVISASR